MKEIDEKRKDARTGFGKNSPPLHQQVFEMGKTAAPGHKDLEEAVLGAMMLEKDALHQCDWYSPTQKFL